MELLVNPASYSNALTLIKLGVHQIFLGDNQFCTRNNCHVTLKQLQALVQQKKNTKVLVLVNRFFFEPEIKALEDYLMALNKIAIDGIIFADFAVNQICYEKQLTLRLIYNPETLVTNYEQFPFYQANNIQEVALARELNHNEIRTIATHKRQMRTQVQAAGYAYMMHSRWKLISNFQQTYNLAEELIKTKLLVREVSRQTPSLIYEDECGTHVFTSYALNLIEYLPDLYAYGVDVVRVDSFLHDDDWTTQTTKVFLEALQHIDDRVYLQKLISQLPSDNYSHGFYLMRKEDLVYLKDEAGAYE